MNFIQFQQHFRPFVVFSLADIRNIEPDFDLRRLSEWQNKGYIQKIIRGYYRLADFSVSDLELFRVANVIYSPSYISLEIALSYYGFIPESVYAITSVTALKTSTFQTPIGTYSYQTIKPSLMFGTKLIPLGNTQTVIGEPEKVLLDFFYLHPELNSASAIEGIRFNEGVVNAVIDWDKLAKYVNVYETLTLERKITLLKEVIHA